MQAQGNQSAPDLPVPSAGSEPGWAAGLRRVRSSLAQLALLIRAMLVFQRAGWIASCVLAAAVLGGLIDYWFRFPTPVRLGAWSVSLISTTIWLARSVWPALRFHPRPADLALRLEQTEAGVEAGLRGTLASGLELGEKPGQTPVASELAALAVSRALQTAASFGRPLRVLNLKPMRRTVAAIIAVGVPVLALGVVRGELLTIGTARILLPWVDASWPKRTAVQAAPHPAAHARGAALPLRAILTRSDNPAGRTDVSAVFRVTINGVPQPARRVLLTFQQDAPERKDSPGEFYERLLDTESLVPAGARDPQAQVSVAIRYETDDDATPEAVVRLVEPPAIIGARATVEPPAYATQAIAGAQDVVRGARELGAGRDERAVLGPVLAGSLVTLRFEFNKSIPVPPSDGEAIRAWAQGSLQGLEAAPDLHATLTDRAWVVSFRADRSARFPVVVRDEFGITPSEESAYRLEVVEDRVPGVAIVDPAQDESVLPTAAFSVIAEGRDDIGLAWVDLEQQIARPPPGSSGAPPEPMAEPATLKRAVPESAERAALTLVRALAGIDLQTMDARPGDEVWLVARAADLIAAAGDREPASSGVRRIRIIAESELVEQMRAELSAVRESAKRLAEDQQRAKERTRSATDATQTDAILRDQRQVGDRMTPMGDTLQRLQQRAARNRLEDDTLSATLRDAQELLDEAGRQSDLAEQSLQDAGADSPQARQHLEQASEAQQEAQRSLEQIAEMLDQGRDTWAARRTLERLITQQQQVRQQTEALGESTRGKSTEELSRNEREDLERAAQRQSEVAQQTAAAIESLEQQAARLQQADPGAAKALQIAAQRARENQVRERQEEAARQVRENQTGAAQQQQQQAEQTLQQMLEELERTEAARDEELRRVLADLMESIRGLVATQQAQLATLAKGDLTDTGMIMLQRNTLSVTDTVRAQLRGGEEVAALLAAAGQAQGSAIGFLRAGDQGKADADERASLAKLNEAITAAEKLQEQADERESQRQRAELKKEYAAILEQQASLATEAMPLMGKELNRRERVTARQLGERQGEIRAMMDALRSKAEGMEEARVFMFAHRRTDDAMARAAQRLTSGSTTPALAADHAGAIRGLQQLIQALSDSMQKRDFREDDGGGGGGGGGSGGGGPGQPQPLIPPVAELKLLRSMQAEAAELTRLIAEAGLSLTGDEGKALRDLQSELAGEGALLLKRMQEQSAPDAAPAPQAPEGGGQ